MMASLIRHFQRDRSGTSATEFALLTPVLLLLFLGSITAFDMFRTAQNIEKATFTIGDMLARKKEAIDQPALDNMLVLLRNTVPSARSGGLRVSGVVMVAGKLEVRWSQKSGAAVPSTPVSTGNLPKIKNGDGVLVIESFVPHQPIVAGFGFSEITFSAQAAYRPRFVALVDFRR